MGYINEHKFKGVFLTKDKCKVNLHFFSNSRFSVLFFYHFIILSLLRKNYYGIGVFILLFYKNQTMIKKPKISDRSMFSKESRNLILIPISLISLLIPGKCINFLGEQ